MFVVILSSLLMGLLLPMIFYILSKESQFDSSGASVFECGFSSYYFSRYSFCIQFFMIALIFLFLDLELCILMPFFFSMSNSYLISFVVLIFIVVLLMGLLKEWKEGILDWTK